MYCAECGQKTTRIENGALLRCCHGYGYWADIEPDHRDGWFPVVRVGRFWLYQKHPWPKGGPGPVRPIAARDDDVASML